MLETVKQSINNLPCISFEEYYQYYVMDVQDHNIDAEVSFMVRNNNISSRILNQIIGNEIEVLNSDK